jgi:hypothetical protein
MQFDRRNYQCGLEKLGICGRIKDSRRRLERLKKASDAPAERKVIPE